MDKEDSANLSDASLVEEEEAEAEVEAEEGGSSSESVIDLPGIPVTAPIEEPGKRMEVEDFNGFRDADVAVVRAKKMRLDKSGVVQEELLEAQYYFSARIRPKKSLSKLARNAIMKASALPGVGKAAAVKPAKPQPAKSKPKPAPMTQTSNSDYTAAQASGGGGLKLKLFSKMSEKNQLGSPTSETGKPQKAADTSGGIGIASSPSLTVSRQKRSGAGTKRQAGSQPSVSITPVSGGGKRTAFGSPGELMNWQQQQQQQQQQVKEPEQYVGGDKQKGSASDRPILRPTHSTMVTCNIHCSGVSGFPTLSCKSCQSMFHPPCVGLAEGTNYEGHDFYCISCQPPAGKENFAGSRLFASAARRQQQQPTSSPSRATSSQQSVQDAFPPHGLPKGLSIIPSSSAKPKGKSKPFKTTSSSSYGKYQQQNGLDVNKKSFYPKLQAPTHAAVTSRRSSSGNAQTAAPNASSPAPVEAQSVINIAGNKYLVVPHPANKTISADGGKKTTADCTPTLANTRAGKLLLRPFDKDSNMPSFEVEESPDGKLVLVPASGSPKLGKNPFKKQDIQEKVTYFATMNLLLIGILLDVVLYFFYF